MTLKELKQYLHGLNWSNPEEVQQEAINKLKDIDDYLMIALITPLNKQCWENAAIVLRDIGFPKNKIVLPGLIEWIRDMNWPGADVAWSILETINPEVLLPFIEEATVKAIAHNDVFWISSISQLVYDLGIPKDMFRIKGIYEEISAQGDMQ